VCASGSVLDRDVKPERLKVPDVPTDSFPGVAPIEVVGPKRLVEKSILAKIGKKSLFRRARCDSASDRRVHAP
jgi:hypothetical protein